MVADGFEIVNGRKVATMPSGRRCSHPQCHAILSIYNRSDKCHCHDTPKSAEPPKEVYLNWVSKPGFHSDSGIHIADIQYNGRP